MALDGIGGLNPKEQKILEDGKITYEEAKGLTAAEKAELVEKLVGHENEIEGFAFLKSTDVEIKPLATIDINTDKIYFYDKIIIVKG